MRPDVLTQKIMHALATGNWVGGRSGVSQLLDRTTYLAALSHMRRVTSPLVRSQPHFEARESAPYSMGEALSKRDARRAELWLGKERISDD
ncbi:MAG: hypothetical protein Ct9H90mP14_2570 [Methanobacteriota archaeon]|nr:MAG: hypothetical protein Ct9H90mP14_2570 [Euryarchaeota archaeon]